MGVLTTLLKLLKPGENDYYNQQTEQADNWQKVDDYAVYTDRDKNAIWGGLDGGGLIEDPSVTKVVGKRYIGADGKAYICLVPSNINNSTNYAPCNTVDNLSKLQNSFVKYSTVTDGEGGVLRIMEYTRFYIFEYIGGSKGLGAGEKRIIRHNLDLVVPVSTNYFACNPITGNNGTVAQTTRIFKNTFEIQAGTTVGLNPTLYWGCVIDKLEI